MNEEQNLSKIENTFKNWDSLPKTVSAPIVRASFTLDLLDIVDDQATFEAALEGLIERATFTTQTHFVVGTFKKNRDLVNTDAFVHWCEANAHEFRGEG